MPTAYAREVLVALALSAKAWADGGEPTGLPVVASRDTFVS